MRELVDALKLLGRNDAPAIQGGALELVAICAVVAMACALVTVLQIKREKPVAAPTDTLNSAKETQVPIEIAVPSKPEELTRWRFQRTLDRYALKPEQDSR